MADDTRNDWCVYILQCGDGSLYTGITNNLEERLKAHESGTGAKYTKSRAPFVVKYTESNHSRSAASKREWEIKQLSRIKKLQLIVNGL